MTALATRSGAVAITETIRLLRDQAMSYEKMALELELTFGLNGRHSHNGRAAAVTVADVKQLIGDRAMRRANIARELGVHEAAIAPIVTPENGFRIGERGWITVQDAPVEEGRV